MPFGFTRMNENDLYNADQVCNENFENIEDNVLPSEVLTAAQYEALAAKEADRLYAVIGTGGFSLYLGELPLLGGSLVTAGTMTALTSGTTDSVQGEARYIWGE